MINQKLEETFNDLKEKTKDCYDILEFRRIATPVVQKIINLYWKEIENSVLSETYLLNEILEGLNSCIPPQLPYRVLAINSETGGTNFGFIRLNQ